VLARVLERECRRERLRRRVFPEDALDQQQRSERLGAQPRVAGAARRGGGVARGVVQPLAAPE
jgi:hypothetical protein